MLLHALAAALLALDSPPASPSTQPSTVVPEERMRERHDLYARNKAEQLAKGPVELVLLGDSITDAWDDDGKAVLQERFGKYNPLNLGIGGDRTENVIWRLRHGAVDGLKPKALVLMLGTNNLRGDGTRPAGEIVMGMAEIVRELRTRLPETKILLLAVFPRGRAKEDSWRVQLPSLNYELKKLAEANGPAVTWLDINAAFLDAEGKLPEAVMPDALHPNAEGYRLWADAMGPTVEKLMGE